MKKNMLALLFIAIGFCVTSCHKISGEGPVVSRKLNITNFSGLYAGIDGDIYFTQGNDYSVEIIAQQNIQDIIEATTKNGELNLQFQRLKNVTRHSRITVYVTAPSINSLGINGSGDMHVLQPIHSTNMSLRVNGSGTVYIADLDARNVQGDISGSGKLTVGRGSVDNEDLHISGSGTIDMLGLAAYDVNTSTSGSGTTKVNVSHILNSTISGSGNVYYIGNPIVYSSISGSGKVIRN